MCDSLSSAALVPGKVQNLRSTLDDTIPSLILNWDKPSNAITDEDVTAYDIRFPLPEAGRHTGYRRLTLKAPATSVRLTRESGLKPLLKYEFEVRSRNAEREGEWSTVSKYIGVYSFQLTSDSKEGYSIKRFAILLAQGME